MRDVSDAFLLEIAGIAATLLGFFVVGLMFFLQRGMFPQAAEQAERYMRAAARVVIALFGMSLILALSLVVLATSSVSLLYAGVCLILLWSLAAMSAAVRRLHRALNVRVMPQVASWLAALAIFTLPWALGGFSPERADFAWSLLLIGAVAFISSASLMLFAFEISGLESSLSGSRDGSSAEAKAEIRSAATVETSERVATRLSGRAESGTREIGWEGASMKEEKKGSIGKIDEGFATFGRRLDSILGKGRIPRKEKEERAAAAMEAVEDLVATIEEELVPR